MDYIKAGKIYLIAGLSLAACVFLSNLFSWCKSKKFKEPIYKSDKDLAEETHIPTRSVKELRKKMLKDGFLIIEKRRNLKFNGATPYLLNLEKIRSTGNKEICVDLQKALTENALGTDKKRQCLGQKLSQAGTENVPSYIDTEEYYRRLQQKKRNTRERCVFSSSSFFFRKLLQGMGRCRS